MDQSFSGCRVTVMGLGTFGAGVAATRFFSAAGAAVTVTDLRCGEQLAESVQEIAQLPNVNLCLGRHHESDFLRSDLIVYSPAVRPDHRLLQLAQQQGVAVTSEIRLFWERCQAPIIGITGSNGKSTTATLVRDILAADGRRVWLGGNIGRSLLGEIGRISSDDWVVLELSSFQLADLDSVHRSPHIAVITNLAPNHLDWHISLQDYYGAKETIVRWQMADDVAIRLENTLEAGWPTGARSVWCGRRPGLDAWIDRESNRTVLRFDEDSATIDLDDCANLQGTHLQNAALLAAATGRVLGVNVAQVRTALQRFEGLAHRLQKTVEWEQRTFINDSAATTPESTIAALASVDGPILLIVGGAEKGCALDELAQAIVRDARIVLVIGDVGESLVERVSSVLSTPPPPGTEWSLESIECVQSLQSAVRSAVRLSRPGETILFSPGFASGTMFRNFADRGEQLVQLVGQNIGAGGR